MKKLFTIAAFVCISVSALAQVKEFNINGETFYGTKAIPDALLGKYLYEKTKEPIVDVQKGEMAGKFQVHDVPAYPASFWVQTDAKGVVQMEKSTVNNNYQVILILEYGSNGESGWKGNKKGTFDRIQAAVAYSMGYAIILGERFKAL